MVIFHSYVSLPEGTFWLWLDGFLQWGTAVRCNIRQVEESALAVDGLLKQLARDREAIFKAGILQVEGMPSFLP